MKRVNLATKLQAWVESHEVWINSNNAKRGDMKTMKIDMNVKNYESNQPYSKLKLNQFRCA